MSKKLIIVFGLFFLLVSLVFGNYIDFNIDFDISGSSGYNYPSGSLGDCGNLVKIGNINDNVFLCKWESFAGEVKNSTNTFDSSSDSSLVVFTSGIQGISWLINLSNGKDNLSLTNSTRISFDLDCTTSADSTSGKTTSGFVTDITGNEILPSNFNRISEFKTKSNNADHCRLSEFEGSCINGFKRFNFSVGEMLAGDSNCTTTSEEIKYFLLSTSYNGADSQYLDNVRITHVNNGSNKLPVLNITPNVSIPCVTEQDVNYVFNFTVDSFDSENDTIYYSIQNVRTFTTLNQTQIKYEKTPLLFTYPDYSFLASTYFSSDSCDINKESELGFNTSQINLLEHKDFDNVQRWMLGLSSTCNGDSEFTYILPNSYFDLFYYTTIYGFQSTNESLNISFYNSDFNLISRVKYVVYNSTIIQIYDYDGTDFSQLGNFSLETILDVAFKIYNSNNNFTLQNLRNSGVYVLSMLQNESVKYIKLENENGVIYQNGFSYSGVSYDLESYFTLNKPNNVTIYHKGISSTSFITVRVTDNLHLGDSYNSESIVVTSVLCENKAEFIKNPSVIKGFLGLRNGIHEACSKLDTAFGINFLCLGLNLFYILIVFGISFLTSFVIGNLAKNVGLGMFFILFGIGVLMGNLFLVLSALTNFIFSMCFVMGVIVMFRAFFGHGEGIGE